MKILDLVEFYSERGGGVRSYLGALLDAASKRGHEVVLVAPGPRDSDERVPGGRIIRYRAPRMPYDGSYHVPLRLQHMREWVRELAPDVLQLSSPYLPWLATTRLDAPLKVYVYHTDPMGAYVEPGTTRLPEPLRGSTRNLAWSWIRRVCRSCDATVVSGDWLRADLRQRGITRVHSLPFGIRHRDFGDAKRSGALRAELLGDWASRPEARVLIVGGRLALEKRQALLIRACSHVARSRPLAVVVLGDGPERAKLEALARQNLPRCRFIPFTQEREHYAALLASADALVHGSRCETYGFLLVEALASGTPLVVPDAGGAAQVAHGIAIEKYAPDSGEAEVAAAITRLLARPRSETRPAALAAAQLHPSQEQHFDALFALYGRMLEQRARGIVRARAARRARPPGASLLVPVARFFAG